MRRGQPIFSRSGFSTARMLLIAGFTGALGFLGLIVAREYGMSRGNREVIERIESQARDVARFVHDKMAGPAVADPAAAKGPPPLRRPADPRVRILKAERKLRLFDGQRLVAEWDVHLGTKSAGAKTAEGDGKTPEGLFYVCSRNSQSKFHRFLGLSYPGIEAADRGLADGVIDWGRAEIIRRAIAARNPPPSDTPLGGDVGIHGTGGPDRPGDWTDGCIAMSDEAVEQLFRVLEIGDPVEIKP